MFHLPLQKVGREEEEKVNTAVPLGHNQNVLNTDTFGLLLIGRLIYYYTGLFMYL